MWPKSIEEILNYEFNNKESSPTENADPLREAIQDARNESLNTAAFFHKIKEMTELPTEWEAKFELLYRNILYLCDGQADQSTGFYCANVKDADLPWGPQRDRVVEEHRQNSQIWMDT